MLIYSIGIIQSILHTVVVKIEWQYAIILAYTTMVSTRSRSVASAPSKSRFKDTVLFFAKGLQASKVPFAAYRTPGRKY